MRHFGRRDNNESTILSSVDALHGLWIPGGPLDGWLWDRRAWHLCEVKRPDKEGHKHEFTDDQLKLIIRLKERSIPFHVLRTDADVLALMGARQTA